MWRAKRVNTGAAAGLLTAWGLYVVVRYAIGLPTVTNMTVLVTLMAAVGAALLGYIGRARSEELNRKCQLVLAGSVLGVVMVEVGAQLLRIDEPSVAAVRKNGDDFDGRSLAEFIVDRRRSGQLVYAYMNPIYLGVPGLTPISEVRSVYCNERGTYDEFETDKFGFRNPPGLWSRTDFRPRLVVLGDSLVAGCGAQDGQAVVDILRARFEAATLNAAVGGSGPLQQYAVLREYIAPLRPEVILWFYFEANDLGNLAIEKGFPDLRHYLESSENRDLASRQWSLREELIRWHEASLTRSQRQLQVPEDTSEARFGRWVGVKGLLMKSVLISRVYAFTTQIGRPSAALTEEYVELLGRAMRLVETWQGQIYVVYAPELARYTEWVNLQPLSYRGSKARLLERLRAHQIRVIDLEEAFRKSGLDGKTLYPSGLGSDVHFNAAGNAAAAAVLMEELRAERRRT